MRQTFPVLLAGVLSAGVLAPIPAHAQDDSPDDAWAFVIGAGGGIAPEYEGSEDYDLVPYAMIRVERGPYWAALTGPELKANVLPDETFEFGPLVRYRGERDDVSNDAVDALEDVDAAVEVGGFAAIDHDGWLAEASVVQDVGGGHEGLLAELEAGYRFTVSEAFSLTALASTGYASGGYMSAYFGVDNDDSVRSGLDAYDADAGFKDVGLSLRARYAFSEAWALTGVASYKRLLGDAADSPVVDDEGSENQVTGIVGLSYAF
ncbi:MipA/OmpV family protein [Marinivivus vitaminiproducens]|uniref:MipA/OmpV family protein n=1 Tax=Marinivivus vitaminiproducens TaxID=3035935 RepID=UPI00279CFF5A|nr:MipA/OmpV family protein [Geminicoccaceae bacterium SCSIO 64248]